MTHARRLSRLTSVATAVIAALLLQRALVADATSSLLVVAATLVAATVSAVLLWFRSSFEAHLVATLVAGVTGLGTLLSLTLGIPGSGRSSLTVSHAALLVLPLVVWTLQTTEHRQRARLRQAARTPYAP